MSELVHVTTPGELVRWHALSARAYEHDHDRLPAHPVQTLLPRLDASVGDERLELWLLCDGGSPVAAGELSLPVHDNVTSASVGLQTDPGRRGRGFGRRLLEHLLERVREHGRGRVFLEVPEPLHDGDGPDPSCAGNRLAARVGARPVLQEDRRLLDLDQLPPATLAQAREGAAAAATGYTLTQFAGAVPEDTAAGLAQLRARMSVDAPQGEMDWDAERWDVARLRDRERLEAAQGWRTVTAVVHHDASGQVCGYTTLATHAATPSIGEQWDTLVHPDHRGHRLGLLLKAANLQRLRSDVPGVRYVNTWNAAVNRHMLAINDLLGFRPVEHWWEWQLEL